MIVPDPGRFDQIVASLDTGTFTTMTTFTSHDVDLALPKYRLSTALSLAKVLARLGMPTAFSDLADFSGMTAEEKLVLRDVVHQADIAVDEQGTTAAAATAVIAGITAVPADLKTVRADHPFLYVLRDRPTGAVLFAGAVTDPSAS